MEKRDKQKEKNSSFLSAIDRNDLEGVGKALDQGADIEAKDNIGQTALIAASRRGNLDIVRLLIERGADVNARLRIIDEPRRNLDAELASPDKKFQDMVYLCIEFSGESDTNETDPLRINGTTALMEAARHGHTEVVILLIKSGADINASTDKNKWTALMSAANEGNLEIVRILIENGADTEAMNSAGFTALYWARKHHYKEIAELLEKKIRK